MQCPACQKNLIQIVDGKAKLRTPVVIFSLDGKKCSLICPKCSQEVEAPITLAPEVIRSAERRKIVLSR